MSFDRPGNSKSCQKTVTKKKAKQKEYFSCVLLSFPFLACFPTLANSTLIKKYCFVEARVWHSLYLPYPYAFCRFTFYCLLQNITFWPIFLPQSWFSMLFWHYWAGLMLMGGGKYRCACDMPQCRTWFESGKISARNDDRCAVAWVAFPKNKSTLQRKWLAAFPHKWPTIGEVENEINRLNAVKSSGSMPLLSTCHFDPRSWEYTNGKSRNTTTYKWRLIDGSAPKKGALNHPPPPGNHKFLSNTVTWEKLPEPTATNQKSIGVLQAPSPLPVSLSHCPTTSSATSSTPISQRDRARDPSQSPAAVPIRHRERRTISFEALKKRPFDTTLSDPKVPYYTTIAYYYKYIAPTCFTFYIIL